MGYLHELRQELEDIIGDQLDEETKKNVLNFVSRKVYDSWKNGKNGGAQGKAKAEQKPPPPNSTSAVSN